MPGGVSSPVRAFRSVGGKPRVLVRGAGPFVFDADGNRLIDLVGSWGPLILGHAPPAVVRVVAAAARNGTTFGAPCPGEVELARLVTAAVPIAEKVRFVNSGTEAVMTAVRLARAATGRNAVVKFDGCYHGHADAFLVAAGSGVATLGIPGSAGVPSGAVADTWVLPLDDDETAARLFAERGEEIAAVLIEPVPANAGLLVQRPEFLRSLRDLCTRYGALLVFDEVLTGFRLGRGGAAAYYDIRPDLVTLGKIIGGGLPVGAVAGPAHLLDRLAPDGPVYQAGTLSGNPLAMAAGAATLALLGRAAYARLDRMTARLQSGLGDALRDAGLDGEACVARIASIFWICFGGGDPPRAHRPNARAARRYAAFHAGLLRRGVYAAPSAYEVGFVSLAHGNAEIDAVVDAARDALAGVREIA